MLCEEKVNLSKVRMDCAEECIKDAKALFENGSLKGSMNRSYYAVFHAMRAVLVFDDFDSKKHSGIISEFRKLYIKTGVFDSEISKTIGNLFYVRSHSDYDDFYLISKEEAKEQLIGAENMVRTVSKYLKDTLNI